MESIITLLAQLDGTKSAYTDEVHPCIFMWLNPVISEPLAAILKESLSTRFILSDWSSAKEMGHILSHSLYVTFGMAPRRADLLL